MMMKYEKLKNKNNKTPSPIPNLIVPNTRIVKMYTLGAREIVEWVRHCLV